MPRKQHKPDSNFMRGWKGTEVTSQASYRKIQNAITEYDRVVSQYERRWGCDRLPNLVDMDLRDRFWQQMDKLNKAISDNNPIDVEHQVQVTIRAYSALEAKAVEMGGKELTGIAWTATSHDSTTTVAVVQDSNEIPRIKREMPEAMVYSVAEVANIIASWEKQNSLVGEVKNVFEGAHVTKIEELIDDEIPF